MKRILLAGATLLALTAAQPTLAADAPVYKGPAPSAVALFNWSGFYVGIHGGGAWTNVNWDHASPFAVTTQNISGSDAIFGGHVGLQGQFGNWVLGGELSWTDGFRARQINGIILFGASATGDMRAEVESLLLATARLGYASDRWHTYVKGGYAGARIDLVTNDNVPPNFATNSRKVHNGWTVGIGTEYAILNNLIFGLEYNYVNLRGSDTVPVIDTTTGLQVGASVATANVNTIIQTVLARLSLKFGS